MAETAVRPLRFCDLCMGLDDHPRHVVAHRPGEGASRTWEEIGELDTTGIDPQAFALAAAQLMNADTTIRHIDCCKAAGCEVCAFTEDVTGGIRGDDLTEYLTSPEGRKTLRETEEYLTAVANEGA